MARLAGSSRVDQCSSTETLQFLDLRLDRQRGVLYRLTEGGVAAPIGVGPRAAGLLAVLVERQGEVVSKDEIMKAVWKGRVVEESNLNVQIAKLRRILGQTSGDGDWIETIPGRGYRFTATVTRSRGDEQPPSLTTSAVYAPPRQSSSIVVLPFDDLSPDHGMQYFADAITEDLTTNLSRFTNLLVIARNTAFTYRDRPRAAKQIGLELSVRYVLEGSVRWLGERVRINVQLIDAETEFHLWAEIFDRQLLDLFEMQDEITTAIAGAIEPELLRSERNRVASRPLQNADAYDLYQRGLWHFYRYTKEDGAEAEGLFRRALEIDAQYPQPPTQLALTLCTAAFLGWAHDITGNYVEAYELAQRAISLDPRYPPAHFALGIVCMWTRRRNRAISGFQEAITLNPSYAAAYAVLGQMHLYRGHPEAAIELAEKAIRLSPKDPRLFIWLPALAGAHYQLRNYAEAVEAGQRSWMLNRNWPAGLRYVVAGLAQLGRIEEARAALRELKLLNPDIAFVEGNLSQLYEDRAAVDHILEGLRAAGFD
jgi:TolB-like protein/Flp pilus assembly protein TadD